MGTNHLVRHWQNSGGVGNGIFGIFFVPPPTPGGLLLEDGFDFLLEDGYRLLLETEAVSLLHPENFTSGTATDGTGTYTVTASSELDSARAPWKAFDGSLGTNWAALSQDVNFWIKIQLPSARIATVMEAVGRSDGVEDLITWKIEGSNNDLSWDILYTTGEVAQRIEEGVLVTVNFTNTTAYQFYRLFAMTGDAGNPGLSRLAFKG